MKWSVIGLLLLGVIAAVCVTFMVLSMQPHPEASVTDAVEAPDPEVQVLAAAADMKPREVVESDDVVVKNIPSSAAPEGSFSDPVQVVGKVLVVPMTEGQPFKSVCFASEGSGFHLASVLEEGKRAVSVTLSDNMGMESLLYPGCLVDVITTMLVPDEAGGQEKPFSTTLLDEVLVLAVGIQTIVSPNSGGDLPSGQRARPTVTLLVDPKEAEILKLAMASGSVTLSMRNPMDGERSSPEGTRLTSLTPLWETVIIRGGEAEKKTFVNSPPEPDR